jgi:pimeloyl-ACP methyl ester carboxylesterase
MRIRIEGLDRRTPTQPVVVLEGGAGSALEAWEPVFSQIAALAPVLAYDRRGLGKSDPDANPPTFRHVTDTLRALLQAARIPPPYVLVGHSWGGVLVRAYAGSHPQEVVGLVYLDATDWEVTRAERDEVLPKPSNPAPAPPPAAVQLPPNLPEAARAEYRQVLEYSKNGFAAVRELPAPPSVPVGVVIAGVQVGPSAPTGIPAPPVDILRAFKRLQIRHQSDWALSSPAGLLLVSSDAGHQVMKDAPALVLQAIRHVVDHVMRAAK